MTDVASPAYSASLRTNDEQRNRFTRVARGNLGNNGTPQLKIRAWSGHRLCSDAPKHRGLRMYKTWTNSEVNTKRCIDRRAIIGAAKIASFYATITSHKGHVRPDTLTLCKASSASRRYVPRGNRINPWERDSFPPVMPRLVADRLPHPARMTRLTAHCFSYD